MAHAIYTSKSKMVGVDEARCILENMAFPGQRRVRPAHVKKLANAQKKGTFRQGTNIDIAVFGKHKYLINGQHTLNAIMQSGMPQSLIVVYHTCTSMEEIHDLYVNFDNHLKRTPQDSMAAYNIKGMDQLEGGLRRAIYGATGILSIGFSSINQWDISNEFAWFQDTNTRMKLVSNWMPEAIRVSNDVKGQAFTPFISLVSVLSVALVTYRFADKPEVFWAGLAEDDGLKRGDPRKALILLYADKTRLRKFTYQRHVISRYVASGWNAFRRGEERTTVLPQSSDLPIRILDTPHQDRKLKVYVNEANEVLHDPIMKE